VCVICILLSLSNMKFFNSRYIFGLYNRALWPIKSIQSTVSHHQFLVCRSYSSLTTTSHGISTELLQNSGVRSYLNKLISEDYSEDMSKPNVSALISAIRLLKVDLQSLNEFDIGQYHVYFSIQNISFI